MLFPLQLQLLGSFHARALHLKGFFCHRMLFICYLESSHSHSVKSSEHLEFFLSDRQSAGLGIGQGLGNCLYLQGNKSQMMDISM